MEETSAISTSTDDSLIGSIGVILLFGLGVRVTLEDEMSSWGGAKRVLPPKS